MTSPNDAAVAAAATPQTPQEKLAALGEHLAASYEAQIAKDADYINADQRDKTAIFCTLLAASARTLTATSGRPTCDHAVDNAIYMYERAIAGFHKSAA